MKTPPEDHDLIRWLDGEMPPAEHARFTARLDADPALRRELEQLQRLSRDLRAHLPAEMPVPYADFFNSQIQVRLAQEEAPPVSRPQRAGWLARLRAPGWATLATAAAVLVAGVMIWRQDAAADSRVLSTYAPNPGVQARVFHSEAAQATVLLLDGLEALPADRKVVGHHIERSETEAELATTTLYGRHGEVVLVMAKDARNQPRLLAAHPRG